MRSPVPLLGAQTVALGLAMAFLVVPASSILLSTYGAGALPFTYMAVAVAGVVVSWLMTRAQCRWSLARVTLIVLGTYTAIVTAAWLALSLADATWVTFPLIVLFPLAIPIGFVLVGTQAGRLLDVRVMKASFPRVVAGFSVGFAVGGLAAASLVGPLGGPEPLLAFGALVGLCFMAIAAHTARRYPAELAVPPEPPGPVGSRGEDRAPVISTRALLGNRLVVLVFGYQILSAIVTQLLDFMVWERSAARYPDPADLARFLGLFGALINVVSVLFVALVAGRLLTRFGVRLGLAANPGGVLVLLVVSAAVGFVAGPASTAFFVLVCAQQVTDISLTDGTTRTSINATYQALPPALRVATQTRVEGIGVPLAVGFTGAFLLVMDALDLGVVTLVVIALALTVIWLSLARAAYAGYGANLRTTLTRRAWDPVALRLDEASRAAVQGLIEDGDPRDLRLGLEVLADADDPTLPDLVRSLVGDPDPARRAAAVAASGRAAGTGVDPGWVPGLLVPLLEDPDARVRTAAEIALAQAGGPPARSAATRRWADALAGGDPDQQRTALEGAVAIPDPAYAPSLVALASGAEPPEGLLDALAANADSLVPRTQAALDGTSELPWPATRRLVAALGTCGSPGARAALVRHLGGPEPRVADAVLDGLVAGGPLPPGEHAPVREAVQEEVQRSARVLAALAVLDGHAHVARGLRDEAARSRRRTIGLFGLLHDPTALTRTVGMLGVVEGDRPLALETLEVTVGRGALPTALALLDPVPDEAARLAQLAALVTVPRPPDARAALLDLVEDPDGSWRDPWLQACALHALAGDDPQRARVAATRLVGVQDAVTAETVAWVLGIGEGRGRAVPGRESPGPTLGDL